LVKGITTPSSEYRGEQVVLASGSWSGALAAKLGLKIPMVGGRGYSITYDEMPFTIQHPVILTEARVALTPMAGNKLRIGGTMEITSLTTPPRMNRVAGILESVKKYFPDVEMPFPGKEKIWFGYRPCSADGLPYIGNVSAYNNLVIASGHAMVGLSLGAATGKLVSEIISGNKTSINIQAFKPERFD
jgi:D-amino-acid dehydrogenase